MLSTLKTVQTNGDIYTKLSLLVFGLGNMKRGQMAKGLIFLAIEIAALIWFFTIGLQKILELPGLGSNGAQTKEKIDGYWHYDQTTPSVVVLLYGVVAICCLVALIWFATVSCRSAYKAQEAQMRTGTVRNFQEDVRQLTNDDAHITFMTLPTLGILLFTILPLIFMISMAFTSYDSRHTLYFEWVGFENFGKVLSNSGGIVNLNLFVGVLVWTLVWAFFATFLNYFLGMFVAMMINRRKRVARNFLPVRGRAAVRIPAGHALHVATARCYQPVAHELRAYQRPPAVLHRYHLGSGDGHCDQPMDRHPVHHHADHWHSAKHPG